MAEIWLTSSDRNAITAATHAIDRELAEDASTKGSEVKEELRAIEVSSLKALFAVLEDDRIVELYRVLRT